MQFVLECFESDIFHSVSGSLKTESTGDRETRFSCYPYLNFSGGRYGKERERVV